ncbi:MAG: hypothetical protein E6902_14615 [Paeniclostridium sordellii]|nr:hypothetical protein [Paeniclostridium sordellii]
MSYEGRCIFDQEDINILCRSECVKRYRLFPELIEKYKIDKKPIYLEDIEFLKKANKDTFDTIKYSHKEIVKEAINEWTYVGFIDSDNKICHLCGSSKLKENFKIINEINKNEMFIGSTCKHKFRAILPDKKGQKKEQKEIKTIKRIKYINAFYENYLNKNNLRDLRDLLDSFKLFYTEFPIILPSSLDTAIVNLLKNSEQFYNLFINGKIKYKNVSEFDKFIEQFNYLKTKSNKFFNDNKSNKFICDKRIIQWIDKTYPFYKNEIKDKIRDNNGFISKSQANKIYCYNFLKKFEIEINTYFKINNFKFHEINENQIIISYVNKENFEIDLSLSLKEFTSKFSNILYNDFNCLHSRLILNDYSNLRSEDYIISQFNLLWTEENLSDYFYLLNNYRLDGTPYYFEPVFINSRLCKSVRVEKNNKFFIEISDSVFISILKSYINKDRSITKQGISTYLSSKKNWKNIKKEENYQKELLNAMRN